MAEYIERKTAIAVACKGCNKEFPNEPCEPSECHIQQGLFNIPDADVVEVVRCKDCKHWKDGVAGCTDEVKCCDIGFYMIGENGYCSYGERKDNE